ncbi:MAG: hypothetical protein IJ720_06750 [Clostridia bacterium]|nr:hypothetical protein [Clostridia bacterium]MBR1705045.1 hypothetical protein [Clostridia bacterium]
MALMLTKEWNDLAEAKAYDLFSAEKTKFPKLSLKVVEVYENVPDDRMGEYVWYAYTLKNGVLTAWEYGTDEDDTPDGDYIIFGDYDAYVKVLDGSVALEKAAVSGMFQIEGNMLKMMKLLGCYKLVMDIKRLDGTTTY